MPTGYSLITGQNPFKGKKRAPFTDEHRRKIGLSGKGRPAWNKGLKGIFKHSVETKKKMSIAHSDENNATWKGDNVGYDALHRWVARKLGLAKNHKCISCGIQLKKSHVMQWANLDGKYTRDLSSWTVFCAKCHYKYDVSILGVVHGRKKRNE